MEASKGLGAPSLSLRAPLLGRDAEVDKLQKAAAAAHGGEARVVGIVGVGGVGKTRLVDELLTRRATAADVKPRVVRGSARTSLRGYGLFGRLLRSRFGIAEGMDTEAAKSQVRSQVADVLDDRRVGDVCFFLGQMMDLKFFDSPLTKAVGDDPSQVGHLGHAIVKSFLEADAAQTPLILVFEDLQLADDESLGLLRHLTDALQGPVLIIWTARPEFLTNRESWFGGGDARCQRIDLQPVDERAAEQIMTELLSPCAGGAPGSLIEVATSLAGGTPGLLEQMVRVFHANGVLEEFGGAGPDPTWKVHPDKLESARHPLTVDEAVEARIGALSPKERQVMEWAAAMGRVFWLGGLVALERMEGEPPEFWRPGQGHRDLDAALESLVQQDHFLELPDSTFPGDKEFVFRHNLERELVLKLTSAAASRQHHEGIAAWLGGQGGVQAEEEHCAMLAEHLEAAGGHSRAGLAFLDAGDIARKNFRARKSAEYYQKGLELLGEEDPRRRIDALHNHGDVLLLLGRRDEALVAFREMLKAAYRLGLESKGGAAHDRMGRLLRDGGALKEARQHLDTALALFEAVEDRRGVAAAHDDIGKLLWMMGDYPKALEELKTALELRKALGDRRSIALSLSNLGRTMLDYGLAQQAREVLEAGLTIRREIEDTLGIVDSLVDLGRLARDQDDHRQALSLLREAYGLAAEVGERNRMAMVQTLIGETHERLGDAEQAVKVLTEAQQLCDELGNNLYRADAERGLAKVHLKQGELRLAREAIKRSVHLFGQARSKPHLAAAVRTLAEITAAGAWGNRYREKAVEYFMRSIQLCKEMGNEIEVAKSYKAFAQYARGSDELKGNTEIQEKAAKLDRMAEEIFAKRREELAAR